MASRNDRSLPVLLIAALVLLVGAIWLGYRETAYYLTTAGGSYERTVALSQGSIMPPLSLNGQQQAMLDCYNAMVTANADLRQALGDKLDASCAAAADAVTARSPTDSLAHLVGAVAYGNLGNFQEMNKRLVLSQKTGPNEQWIASLRVRLVESRAAGVDDAVRTAETADLAVLVHSRRGISSIAKRYLSQPDFRERITQIVEQLPASDQRRFVSNVRQAANDAANS